MASFNEVNSSAYTNNATVVGGVVRNLVRNGTTVTFEYQAYIRQGSTSWSQNAYALWVEGSKNIVKPEAQQSAAGVKYYTNWYTKTVTLNTSVSSCNVSIGVNGNVYYPTAPAGYVTLTLSGIPTVTKPTVSNITVTADDDITISANFTITDDGNEPPSTIQTELSTDEDFTDIIEVYDGNDAVFSGIDAGRTYYLRGLVTNSAGTTYTNVESIATTFRGPGNVPYVTCMPAGSASFNLVPTSQVLIQWSLPWDEGSTPISGFVLKLYKNYDLIDTINITEFSRYNLYYVTDALTTYGFEAGDIFNASIRNFNEDYEGNKHYSNIATLSSSLTVVSDKFIYVSENGGSFNKYKIYISENGNTFTEIKKENFKII